MNPHDRNLTSDYYNAHWNSFASSHYPQAKIMQAERFLAPVIGTINPNQKILDVGCGDGVHWHYLKKIKGLPIHFTGIDIALQPIEFLKNNSPDQRDSFLQMDACELHFDDDSFDFVFAYGVIGYTEDPVRAFKEMARVCKPGGYVGIFSPEIKGVSKAILDAARRAASLLGSRGKQVLADFLVPFFGLAPSESGINLKNATWRQVREVILTDIAPPQLSILPHHDLVNWFTESNIEIIFDDRQIRSILWGKKPESAAAG